MTEYKQNVRLAVIGFFLTGVLGSGLTFLFNYFQDDYTLKQQVRQGKTADAHATLISTMQLCQKRFWTSQRVVWAAESPQYYDLKQVQQEYLASVEDWNLNLATTRLLVQDSLGDRPAQLLVDDKTMTGKSGGQSVQTFFIAFHSEAIDFFRATDTTKLKFGPDQMQEHLKAASDQMDELYKSMIRNYRYVQKEGHPPTD